MASFSVVTNISAVNAQANLYTTNIGLRQALTRVSSGFRINSSGDDAAGLAVANSYRSKVAILTQGIRNANDGLSTLQIQDGALDNISKLLDRLATLATQAASDSGQASRIVAGAVDAEAARDARQCLAQPDVRRVQVGLGVDRRDVGDDRERCHV